MTKTIEFYFDYGSPTSYLAYTQLPALAERTGAEIAYRPVLLGGVMKATGNSPPTAIPPKGVWFKRDMAAFADRYGVPFHYNDHFPVNTLAAMRGAIVARSRGWLEPYSTVVFNGLWVENLDLSQPEVFIACLNDGGIDADAIGAGIGDPAHKESLKLETQDAIDKGLFGAPSFIVDGGPLIFGQDRLDFVEAAARS